MAVISLVGVGAGMVLVLLVVALHYSKGTGWEPTADITQEVLERRAATVAETDFPEPMNRSIGGGGVAAVGAGEEGAELEGEEAEEEQSPADMPEDEVEYFEVEFVKQGETIELASNETVLDQGEDAGMDLPYACRQGQCVSCSAKITDGPADEYVTHFKQETLSDEEMDNGYTLTCVAYPKADFTIETGEAP
ncbi:MULTISPECIES: 2Fe-2S iron-sulfur cluster-binding protein [Haloferax]|uniref:Ferredoxin-1 n=1 Tax=Haloferax massiliensis TaxID=1476858 RepID=A0A0D6JMD2_9EURY|nr:MULTISPECIES: 2Fe-2S iron-sulfur cluster-binding protein [Haloferax]MDS0243300.1 2Fe-2S iron-sulfur cluster-binding protein [Haloferax sp. S2CR25]MDS0446421.1 2Fe-2S iron-sulfur cluster-binding protein [Haloferax sp. S2CR25-2]CQR49019.1 Ferredoxin-1 [Haloferax massiliensis]